MRNSAKKRLFIAFNLPAETKKEINEAINRFSKINQTGIKWSSQENLHITIYFLVILNDYQISLLENSLVIMENLYNKPMLKIIDYGILPNQKNPRIIFISTQQVGGDSIQMIHRLIGGKLTEQSIQFEKREWKPHITIGRIKSNISNINYPKFSLKNIFQVDSFDLMESVLLPDGPEYRLIMRFKFK